MRSHVVPPTVMLRHSGVAIGLLALSTVARWLLDPSLGNQLPYAMLYIAVALIAWRTTTRIAVVSLIVGWVATDFLFVPPRFNFFWHVEEQVFLVGTFTYFAVAATSVIVAHAMRGAQRRAAETGQRLAAMHANTTIGLTELTLDGRWMNVNGGFCRIVGYTRDELLELRFVDITFAEDLPRTIELMSQLAAGDIPSFRLETRLVRKDRSLVWVDVNRALVKDGAGAPLYIVGAIVDITARKQAEERLAISEARLLALFEAAPDGVVVVDPQGIIRAVNAETERLFGYRREEVVGRAVEVLIPDRFAARHVGHRTDDDQSHPATRLMGAEQELFGKRKDGSEFPVDILLSRVENEDGQVMAVVRDASARKRAEGALRQSIARNELILAGTEAAMWDWNVPDKRVAFSPRWKQMRGLSEAEVGDSEAEWSERIHPDDKGRVMDAVAAHFAGQTPLFDEEYRVQHKGGRWLWILDRGVVTDRDAAGAVVHMMGCETEITVRKQAEEQLREADRKKDEFLATLAHELRNPLAPIRFGLAIMKLAGGDARAVEKSRSIMERQVEHMTRLINDLMDVSRISHGKIVLQKTRMPLADAVRDALDASRPLIEAQRHELVVEMPPEPIYVDGDLTRLSQVFANLLNNAAKYTDKGGRIRLAVERQGTDAVVSVEDNGVGIPTTLLTTVFDLFAQVDGSLNKSRGGVGIGLNIAKQLVEKHGGSIVAESGGPGAGSRFVVRLPMMLAVTSDKPDDHNATQTVTPVRRILVVDDDPDGATSLAQMLDLLGNDTATAFDGVEAVAVAETFKPEVIIMDIGMPTLNGYDACRLIRKQPWGRNVIMVAQTGWGRDDDKQRAQQAGFDLHITKPADPAALEKMLAGMSAVTG